MANQMCEKSSKQLGVNERNKLPLDLKLLGWLFILEGVFAWLEIMDNPSSKTSIILAIQSIRALDLPIGIGLLFKIRFCRSFALILIWIRIILFTPFMLLSVLAAMAMGVKMLTWGAAVFGLPLLLWAWCYWVLVRQRNRLVFGITTPTRHHRVILGLASAMVLIFVGLPIAINLNDQELTSDVKRVAESLTPFVPQERNAYFALLGFSAPVSEDPQRTGKRIVSSFAAELHSRWNEPGFKFDGSRLLNGTPLTVKDEAGVLCKPSTNGQLQSDTSNCIDACRVQRDELLHLISNNRAVLARYLSLHTYETVVEEIPFALEVPLLPGQSIRDAQRLLLTQAALQWCQGRFGDALDFLRNDLHFWRNALVSSKTLVSRLIALGSVRSDLSLLLLLSQDPKAPEAVIRDMEELLIPMSEAETNMSDPIRWNFLELKDAVEREAAIDEMVSLKLRKREVAQFALKLAFWGFFKPHATVNRLYAITQDWLELAKTEPSKFRTNQTVTHHYVLFDEGWTLLYNPIGKFYAAIVVPAYSPYIRKAHDTDALLRLIALQIQMRLHKISPGEIPRFLGSVDSTLFDPYTGLPMRWDLETETLFSIGNSESEDGNSDTIVSIPVRLFP